MKRLATVVFLFAFIAGAADVHSGGKWAADYPELVHVILNPDQTITFQYCEGPQLTQCRLLGNKPAYKLRDLRRREQILKRERRALIISDATYVVGSALGATITCLAAPTPAGPVAISLFAASGATGAGLLILKSFMDPGKDGALAKFKAPRTLQDRILNGEAVAVNMPINEFAQQLDEVLKSIF